MVKAFPPSRKCLGECVCRVLAKFSPQFCHLRMNLHSQEQPPAKNSSHSFGKNAGKDQPIDLTTVRESSHVYSKLGPNSGRLLAKFSPEFPGEDEAPLKRTATGTAEISSLHYIKLAKKPCPVHNDNRQRMCTRLAASLGLNSAL